MRYGAVAALLFCIASGAAFSPARAGELLWAEDGGPATREASVCTCYCWCQYDPRTQNCDGGGYCCYGARSVWISATRCKGCYPCWAIFGKASAESACARPVWSALERHLAALRAPGGGRRS